MMLVTITITIVNRNILRNKETQQSLRVTVSIQYGESF